MLKSLLITLISTDADSRFNSCDKNFAITYFASLGRRANSFNSAFDMDIINGQLNFNFRKKVDDVLGAFVNFSATFLSAKAFDFSDSKSFYSDLIT